MAVLLNAVFCIILISVNGCSTISSGTSAASLSSIENKYRNSRYCSPDENLHIETLPARGKLEFTLDENGCRLSLSRGSTYYMLTEMPNNKETMYFNLRSYLVTEESTGIRRGVFPVVAILNDDFTVSRSSDPTNLAYNQKVLLEPPEHLNLFIKMDRATHPREKYIIVYTLEPVPEVSKIDYPGENGWIKTLPVENAISSKGARIKPCEDCARIRIEMRPMPAGKLDILQLNGPLSQPFPRYIKF